MNLIEWLQRLSFQFVIDQPQLGFRKPIRCRMSESAQALFGNHAMAWHDDRQRIRSAGLPNGSWAAAKDLCQSAIGHCLPRGNRLNRLPGSALKWCGAPIKWDGCGVPIQAKVTDVIHRYIQVTLLALFDGVVRGEVPWVVQVVLKHRRNLCANGAARRFQRRTVGKKYEFCERALIG
jgi:hypothetical protein